MEREKMGKGKKQISISKDLYESLINQKKQDETISDLINRLLEGQNIFESNFEKMKQCFGISRELPNEFVNAFRHASKELR